MSVEERKRVFEIAVDATRGRAATIMSCSDQNMDVVLDLALQVGGSVRRPMSSLSDQERAITRAAFENCGLQLSSNRRRARAS
jgi:dihydrodipicolinate synthase/N-acetylneuraminate lyase